MGEAKLIPVYYMGIVTGWGCTFFFAYSSSGKLVP